MLNGLNPAQRAAVTSTAPVILTLAGAGSGKTRVLTHRIAHLNQEYRVGTSNMLALTFTRLAGKEMKERVMKLVGEDQGKKLYCNTFHAFAAGVLWRWGHKLGIDPGYTIYDQEDRADIMGAIINDLKPRTTLKKIMERFDNCRDINEEKANYPEECRVLLEYGYRLRQNNAVDIDRMIDLVVRLWTICPEALEEYQRNYTHVFIDEFQDTSDDQMEMLKLLNPEHLFVVGDDAQAIYGWRKARVEYILSFPDQYPGCEVIKLEDNYRSTRQIIQAANNMIKHNTRQTKKTLIAHKDGPPIECHLTTDEMQECLMIGKFIQIKKPDRLSDIAVLARTNAMVEKVEIMLRAMDIPVQRLGGGEDIFKAPGVRGIINWMDLVHNKKDTMTIKKCMSFISKQPWDLQMKELELEAMRGDKTLYETMVELYMNNQDHFTAPFLKKIQEIEKGITEQEAWTPSRCFQIVDNIIGASEIYRKAGITNKLEDMQSAVDAMKKWEDSKASLGELRSAQAFLKWLRYRDMHEKLIQENRNAVKVMTVHASKGLEFQTVILAGMNQDTFPSRRGDPEEERRLCYVAITRAKDRLLITRSETSQDFRGSPYRTEESQFIKEIGSH